MGNQIRVCTAACQDPILYPPKLEVECHCILTRNQVYLSSYGWLLTVNTVSYRRGAFIKVNVGQQRGVHTHNFIGSVWDCVDRGSRTIYGTVGQWLRLRKFSK